jgi:hypothetical protein
MHPPTKESPPVSVERVLTRDELTALLADAADFNSFDPSGGPLPAVLDTDFVRTGLRYQLNNGVPPRSVRSAWDGSLRLFMEYDTLAETGVRLPRFSDQFGVPETKLRGVLNEEWLPHIQVLRLPEQLRTADPRALQVRDRDRNDFPAAALAALLSPCLLLTHNHRHFGVLGVRTREQGRDGVMAVAAAQADEMRVQAAIVIPAAPFGVAGAVMKWATDRIGPAAWVILGLALVGGTYWYLRQSADCRDRIKTVAGTVGTHALEEYNKAAVAAYAARLQLRACMVLKPEQRTPMSAILRELALAPESLSTIQLAELLDPSLCPPVAGIRAFLRSHDNTVLKQVRRGGFVLGAHYRLAD